MIVDSLNKEIEKSTKEKPCIDMTVKDLKEILKDLDDNMPVVIPSTERFDPDRIIGCFNLVRTAGLIRNDYEEKLVALCLNTTQHGWDISTQIEKSYVPPVWCEKVLF